MTVTDEEYAEKAREQLMVVAANINEFKRQLPNQVSMATDPITPKVAFKLIVFREALLWRTIALADGAITALEAGQILPSILLARAVQENTAANHYLLKKLEQCVHSDSVTELDDIAMKLLLGSRWSDWEHSAVNILSMIDKVEKTIAGFRRSYESLCEYSHPNYSGVALCFSEHSGPYDVSFGNYLRGFGRHFFTATNSLYASLMLFESDYNNSADLLFEVIELCRRDLETNLN